MPTSLPTSAIHTPAPSYRVNKLPALLREPLLHFIVLGGLLFAVDHVMATRIDDPRTIVIGPEVDSEAVEIFEQTRGIKPNKEELKALHQVWLDNEVLYREGLAMQVDKGDTAIRERVIFKALSIIDANTKLPAIDDKKLRDWFESRREKYDDPARYNFEEAVLAGNATEESIRAFVATLNAGKSSDTAAGLRVFKDRPYDNLVQSYGADFPKTLAESTAGEWRAQKTRDGWHAMRLISVTQPKPAAFEELRGVIMQDWKDAIASEQRTAAVRALAKKYNVEFATAEHAGQSTE
jgi:hypothetical protein